MSGDPPLAILNRPDGGKIAYRLREGDKDRMPLVWLGGLNSDMEGTKATLLDHFARDGGRTFLRFDYFAHGRTGGNFRKATLGRWLDDARTVLNALTKGPVILIGSSMGGYLALLLAEERASQVAGLALIAPAADMTEALMWQRFPQTMKQAILSAGEAQMPSEYAAEPYIITRLLIEEGRKHLILERGVRYSGPVRILQGMQDPDVPWQHALAVADALSSTDVSVKLLKSGDHRLSDNETLPQVIALVEETCRAAEKGRPS